MRKLQGKPNIKLVYSIPKLIFRTPHRGNRFSCLYASALDSGGGVSTTRAILIAPLFFGVAHLHHFIENVRQGTPVPRAALITLVQLTYTSLFGMYAAFLFVRTGHLLSASLAHMFCNFMGFPDFGGALQHENKFTIVPVYVIGILVFYFQLFPWSDPQIYNSIFFARAHPLL